MKTKWKLERIDWHKHGLCWSWTRVTKHVYYSGNQVQFQWGRIAFVFKRRAWIYPENAKRIHPHPKTHNET